MVANQISKLLILLLIFCCQHSLFADNLETAKALYEKGGKDYDIAILSDALNLLRQVPQGSEYEHLLQQGIILKRIHFIYYVEGNKKKSKEFGNRAIQIFSEALKYNPKSLEAIAHRGMIYQTFATFGWRSGAKFGPKSKKDIDAVEALDSKHFLYRFMQAITYLESPKFVGGDTKKAIESFASLGKAYPDNEDIQVHLARAYFKNKQYRDAFEIVGKVIENNPKTLFAKRLEKEVKKKLK